MKILRNAREQPWKYKLECTGCDSELEIEADDLRRAPSDPRPGEGPAYICTCPVCCKDNWLDARLVPQGVRVAVAQAGR